MYRESPVPVACGIDVFRADHELMGRLENSEIFRDYRRAFQTIVGLPLAIHGSESSEAPRGASRPINPFCVPPAMPDGSGAAPRQLQRWIAGGAQGETYVLECYAGLGESAVPIRLGERVVGFLRTGQVLWGAPSPERFQVIVRQMREREGRLDLPGLQAAYFATRVIPRLQYEAVLRLLAIFARQLAALGNQMMIAEISAESPAIANARRYIAVHRGEELSLLDVAHAVHMSPYYFCKKFKREIGLTFTRYLSRLRIEEVKLALLQPHTRITQAAFAAGFQSVSQFNRAFRSVVGESPSDYRSRCAGSAPAADELRQPGRVAVA